MKFGLKAKDWAILQAILVEPLKKKGINVLVFGSRARGDHRPFSDIDILLNTEIPLALSEISQLKEKFEESSLPVKVDIVELRDLAPSYKESALKEAVPV